MDILSQRDPRWSGQALGNSPYTLGQSGCFVTELAEIIGLTPDVVNQKLLSGGGFASDGSYNDLIDWSKISAIFPNFSGQYFSPYNNDAVVAALQAGSNIIVEVSAVPIGGSGLHAVRYIGNHQLHDPWTGSVRPTSDFPTVYAYVVITQQQVAPQAPTDNSTLSDALNSCQTQLKSASDQNASLQTQLTTITEQLQSSEENLKDAKSQIATLQAQLDGEQKEIISLNNQIETQASSNKDYATETLDLTHANTDLTNYLYSTADILGVNRANQKVADIQEAILEKLSEVDLLLKAAGLGQGLLHQVAKTFSVDAPDDKTAANNIISYVKQLGGKLQSLVPNNQQASIESTIQQPSFWSKLIGFFWQSKTT